MKSSHLLRAVSAIAVGLVVLGGTAAAKEWSKLRLGTAADDPPSSSMRPDGTFEGFEIELAADICKRMKVECSWERRDFGDLIPALQQGKLDVIFVALSITPKRRETIDFSIPIVGHAQGVLARKSSPLAATTTGDVDAVSLDDAASAQPVIDTLAKALRGKVIGTDAGGARVEMAERYFRGIELRTYPTPEEVRRELLVGHIDAELGRADDLVGSDGSQLQRVGPWFTGGVFGPGAGLGLRKTDPDLKAMLDTAIKDALADGTIKKLHLTYLHYWVPPM
jgi:octopine/nopaline transport system substrate-binding protein